MKLFAKMGILALLSSSLLITSCSKDDDEPQVCSTADWVGIYFASSDCDADKVEALDLVITEGSAENELIFTDSEGDATSYTISNCDIPEFGIFTIKISGFLDGNKIILNVADTDPDDTYSCTITYTRQ